MVENGNGGRRVISSLTRSRSPLPTIGTRGKIGDGAKKVVSDFYGPAPLFLEEEGLGEKVNSHFFASFSPSRGKGPGDGRSGTKNQSAGHKTLPHNWDLRAIMFDCCPTRLVALSFIPVLRIPKTTTIWAGRVKGESFMAVLMENMNWMQIEDYLKKNDRVVLVTGSVEEHGYNSIGTDTQCAWEIAKAACEKTGVLLAPAVNYGFAAWVESFVGTISIRPATYMALMGDILKSLHKQGFKRILVLSGHGQNQMVTYTIEELSAEIPDLNVKFREWYFLPRVYQIMKEYGTDHFDHASWLESFPWINQPVEIPNKSQPSVDVPDWPTYGPAVMKELAPDGTVGSVYVRDEAFMRSYFNTAVEDTVAVLEGNWAKEMFPRS
jgi:creatinine amidohydrolase